MLKAFHKQIDISVSWPKIVYQTSRRFIDLQCRMHPPPLKYIHGGKRSELSHLCNKKSRIDSQSKLDIVYTYAFVVGVKTSVDFFLNRNKPWFSHIIDVYIVNFFSNTILSELQKLRNAFLNVALL